MAKCYERLALRHIKTTLSSTLDQHQYAYETNRSTEDALNTVLHTAKSHRKQKGAHVRLLLVDYSSAFNTIVPSILGKKLQDLGLHTPMCLWIMDFLTNHPQTVTWSPFLPSPDTKHRGIVRLFAQS